jgi:outer membrane protein OmpA-like peptidoglycan-associated protein
MNATQFKLIERNYYSFDVPILLQRAQRIIKAYPNITFTWQNDILALAGTLDITKTEQLLNTLAIAGFTTGKNLTTEQLQLTPAMLMLESKQIKQQIFDDLIGRIASLQLNFPIASDTVTPEMLASLQRLYQYIQQLEPIAKELKINFGLLILGSSDNTGNKTANNIISLKRANNAADILNHKGIDKDKMFVLGLGQIEITDISSTARTVMFNVIHINHD